MKQKLKPSQKQKQETEVWYSVNADYIFTLRRIDGIMIIQRSIQEKLLGKAFPNEPLPPEAFLKLGVL